ncbi:NUDIX hydrolase [Paenibacillus radicis (ex Gao et al. 2016)]|uniref:Nudix hydrolase domain-containing protein n=1 Tax=Paenibacillus radicis (ex Gao et al. 2016) TaxID=1737354 RepID=A0A917M0F3_9BACL|nr:NUDIX hydrolase [Paenibacillus radicis (ex Gao et al. 2016)]GGG69310.1 hypothetical protein GCM10010918_25580 [Paenibacillus radicis (ex Gao et al. 2016)]
MPFPTHIVAAGGFVEDGEGNILLVKTRDGGWVYPGGQVEVGENLMDALVREIQEESGIDTTVSYLIGIYSNTGIFKWYDSVTDVPTQVIFDFVCKPFGGTLAIRTRYKAYLEFNGVVNYIDYVTNPEFIIKYQTDISK